MLRAQLLLQSLYSMWTVDQLVAQNAEDKGSCKQFVDWTVAFTDTCHELAMLKIRKVLLIGFGEIEGMLQSLDVHPRCSNCSKHGRVQVRSIGKGMQAVSAAKHHSSAVSIASTKRTWDLENLQLQLQKPYGKLLHLFAFFQSGSMLNARV